VQKGGHHLNVNVFTRETLLDAQKHPEKYPQLSYSIFERIAELLASAAVSAAASAGTDTVYMAGGVSASSFIRKSIAEKLAASKGSDTEVIFGDPVLSGDNAVGTARLARRIHNR
jgi:tRNA A37 threonylcarbamoyltransferase TsaD